MPQEIYDRTTEKYGKLEAQKEDAWQKNYGKKLPELCKELDEILAGQEENSLSKLENFLEREEIKNNYSAVEEIAVVNIAVQVWKQELQCRENENILNGITSVRQLEARLQKIRFMIYRMEFLSSKEVEDAFIQCMQEEQLTVTAIGAFVIMAAVHPLQVALRIEEEFWRRGMYGKEILFLEFIMQKWPGNQRLLKKLVDLYLLAGRAEYAQRYQREVIDYTDMKELSCEEARILQEILWRIRYTDLEAVEESVKQIEQQQIIENIFLELISRESAWQAEEYFWAADAWLNRGKYALGQKTLEEGKRLTKGAVEKVLQKGNEGGQKNDER